MRRGDQTFKLLSDIVGYSHRASMRVWQPRAGDVMRGTLLSFFIVRTDTTVLAVPGRLSLELGMNVPSVPL
ncbi:hypothetical protein Sme01_61800 [Sphaerisporangium melleum]|uniref:Uncharacterized protein n=1 Tax=Sphaerisporangium melleum TaxID=321316 RepID=A0A917VM75_9ACTN|nr:hypothetical protein GCM10007964_45420 [Sphaerisporangium melleum]GII73704.1 hypothetical protein Sme01_61800 [Sphaerisporangium melleum]